MIASNGAITLDDGDGQTTAMLSDPRSGAIDEQAAEKQAPGIISRAVNDSRAQRETGDEVNRFLLCALVSESAKLIKWRAADAGESLPMPVIVRGVLRSYRLAAEDKYGALAKPKPDFAGLRRLNEKILQDEVARQSRDRIRNSERQLARAEHLGDTTKISAEKDRLEQAIEMRDRLAKKFS